MAAFVERDKENTGKKHNFDYNYFVLIFNVQGSKALGNYNYIIRISIKT